MSIGFAASLVVAIWRGNMWVAPIPVGGPRLHVLAFLASVFGSVFFLRGYYATPRGWIQFAIRMVLFAFSFLVSLLAAEIGIRAFLAARHGHATLDDLRQLKDEDKPLPIISTHPLAAIVRPSDDPRLVYELQPHVNLEFGGFQVRINSQGMRSDREYSRDKPAGCIRIVGIGDSGMFGWDVEQNEDYMTVLENNLRPRTGEYYEVLNLAVPGYNTDLEAEMLERRGLAYQPDVVIVGWCENDYNLPYFMLEKQDYWIRKVSYLFTFLFDRPRFATLAPGIAMRDQRTFEQDRVIPEIAGGTREEGVKAALRKLKTLSEKHGFHLLVFGPMKHTISRICAELNVSYLNTYDAIPYDKYPRDYLLHTMHPTAHGHRVLAEVLEQELETRGWIPPH